MEFLVITGLSGAGKSQIINALEDIGFFCIDNIPPQMIVKFAELCINSNKKENFAVVSDARSTGTSYEISGAIEQVRNLGLKPKLVFLDCDDQTLIRRYKETRRRHPLMSSFITTLEQAISTERAMLNDARNSADYIIDTAMTSASQLKGKVKSMFLNDPSQAMGIRVVSFGFKYGVPIDADLIFDVRCLPNPYYVEDLKRKTGLDLDVRQYVFGFEESRILLDKLKDMLKFLLPLYIKEGKSQLVIAFGCTGGKHRSVSFAHEIHEYILEICNNTSVSHRDIYKK